jgi:uncharacterized membrane protein YedE/YeeE
MLMTALYLVLGNVFGFTLSRSGAADYDFIQAMFLFKNLQLYGIMGSAVVLAAPGLWWIQQRGRTVFGSPIHVELKPLNRGTIVGSLFFGVGWSMAGMCPGPIFVNLGEGKIYALAALAGALVGASALGTVYRSLQSVLGLPALKANPAKP